MRIVGTIPVHVMLRRWRREWRVAAMLVSTIALGVGVNLAIVDSFDQLSFRAPEGVRAPEALVRLEHITTDAAGLTRISQALSYPAYSALRAADEFEAIAGYMRTDAVVPSVKQPVRLRVALCTADYLRTLGVVPVFGRSWDVSGEAESAGQGALISFGTWQRVFGGSRNVLAEYLQFGDRRYQVLGVLPRGFGGPDGERTDAWIPLADEARRLFGAEWRANRSSAILRIVARLRPGHTTEASSRRASSVLVSVSIPGVSTQAVRARSLRDDVSPSRLRARGAARLLVAVAALLLLGMCANVASVLLERGVRAASEANLCRSLGATERQTVVTPLVDAFVLCSSGGVAAWLAGWVLRAKIRPWLLPEIAWKGSLLDKRAAVILALLVVAAMCLVAVLPATFAARSHSLLGMRQLDSRGSGPRTHWQSALLIVQVATSLLLLVGTGVFATTLVRSRHVGMGFDPSNVLLLDVPPGTGMSEVPVSLETAESIAGRLRAAPDVISVSVGSAVPLRRSYATSVRVGGGDEIQPLPTGGPYIDAADEHYARVLGLTISDGRWFTSEERQRGDAVVVINQTLANTLASTSLTREACLYVARETECRTVVGVFRDTRREMVAEGATLQLIVPNRPTPAYTSGYAFYVRVKRRSVLLERAIADVLAAEGLTSNNVTVEELESLLDPELRSWQLATTVFATFALVAICLAAAGLYAVLGERIARAEREVAIRRALGAPQRTIILHMSTRTLRDSAAGVAVGAFGASVLWYRYRPMMTVVEWSDFMIVAGTALLITSLIAVLSFAPRLWSSRKDNFTMLRGG